MDSTAIKTLLETGAAQAAPTLDGAALVPKDWAYISTEKFQHFPSRHRRRFTTKRMADFLAYCQPRVGGDSAIFIAPDISKVIAVLNHGDVLNPAWGDDTATLELDFAPQFQALHKLIGSGTTQQGLIYYLEDFAAPGGCIEAIDVDGATFSAAEAITAVRKVSIVAKASSTTEVQNTRAAKSSMEEVEACGAGYALPAALRFSGEVFHGTTPRTIHVRIALLTSSDKPVFMLRIQGWDLHKEALAAEIESLIRARLEGVSVFVGTSVFAG